MMLLPRRLRIGLAIGGEGVRAIALRAGRIAWAVERARGDEPLERTIGLLLSDAPLTRWPRPSVIAAIGLAHAQTKRLAGLPKVTDRSRLGDVVREGASRFFLKNGVPVVTTCTSCADGTIWGAAVDEPVVQAIERACRARHLRIAAIVPAVTVLGGNGGEGRVTERLLWNDGALGAEILREHGQIVAVRRISGTSSLGSQTSGAYPAALDALGPGGSRFADAWGAVQAPRDTVLAWQVGRGRSDAHGVPRWRLALAVITAIVATGAWLVAPGIVARSTERDAMARLTTLAPVRRDVALAEREVARVTAALGEVAGFDASRYSMTALLGDLTQALPDESALVTLRVTRGEGGLVALTPRAAVVLKGLEMVGGVEAAEIVGPVTSEVVAGKTLERVTVRFRVNAAVRRGLSAAEGEVR